MSTQDRILEALTGRSLAPRALYQALSDTPPQALDFALRALLKDGRIVRAMGRYERPGLRAVAPPRHVRAPNPRAHPGAPLTHREEEIAELAARGETARRLSEQLGIAIKSMHRHLSNIYRKLEVSGKTELAARLRAREAA